MRAVQQPILEFVLSELENRKGQWRQIARALAPEEVESYYSWLCKVAQGRIADPSVNKVQRLFDWLKANPASIAA